MPTQLLFTMEYDTYRRDVTTVTGILTFDLTRPGYSIITMQPGELFIVQLIDGRWHRVRTWSYFDMWNDLFFMHPISEDSYRVLSFDTIRLHRGYFEPGIYRLMAPTRLIWMSDANAISHWHGDWYWQGIIWAEFTISEENPS